MPDSAQSVCALCGQAEGHSARCSVTRHGIAEQDYRISSRPTQSEIAFRQAEGWRRVAVADARAWKARAVAAEAERDRYREALDKIADKTYATQYDPGYHGAVVNFASEIHGIARRAIDPPESDQQHRESEAT